MLVEDPAEAPQVPDSPEQAEPQERQVRHSLGLSLVRCACHICQLTHIPPAQVHAAEAGAGQIGTTAGGYALHWTQRHTPPASLHVLMHHAPSKFASLSPAQPCPTAGAQQPSLL